MALEHGAQAQNELPGGKRLDHVIVGAKLQPDDAVHLLAPGREHDDGGGCGFGIALELLADLEAVEPGEHEIENDTGRRRPPGLGQRLVAVPGRFRGESGGIEVESQQFDNIVVILDDQDGILGHVPTSSFRSSKQHAGLTQG